ncbi:MAG: alpha/beta hydrolase [Spirochaetes bacterium]|nr:alpha/beta hydrolase [Spirochaetota bacterium]
MVPIVPGTGLNRRGQPDLFSRIIRKAFERGAGTAPADYGAALAATRTIADLDYGSSLPDGTMDIILPREAAELLPLVLMVHGGAFIGGDKLDNCIYAVALAARGYAVVNINYQRAPEARYPSPLVQIDEAYRFLAARAAEFGLDLERLFLAGDSAGAHMIAQYAIIQTDPAYASLLGFAASIPVESIRGLLLFCGSYDLKLVEKARGGPFIRLGLGIIGNTYFGRKDWAKSSLAAQVSLIGQVGPAFPPAFITDGNSQSFEDHGKALAARLEALCVPTTTLFHGRDKGRLRHQYQYALDSAAGREAFEAVLGFLRKYAS